MTKNEKAVLRAAMRWFRFPDKLNLRVMTWFQYNHERLKVQLGLEKACSRLAKPRRKR